MNNKITKIVGAFAAVLVAGALILGVFFMMNNKGKSTKVAENQVLLERDLENAYPETPTEVVKLYWRFNKYMYNKKVSDGELQKLMKQLRKLYDEEFLAEEKNSETKMIETLVPHYIFLPTDTTVRFRI